MACQTEGHTPSPTASCFDTPASSKGSHGSSTSISSQSDLSGSPLESSALDKFYTDLDNYIAVGCLRLDALLQPYPYQTLWQEVRQVADVVAQTHLAYKSLVTLMAFSRMRLFHRIDHKLQLSILRVYLLPQDVGGRYWQHGSSRSPASFGKEIHLLVSMLDISSIAWQADADSILPVETLAYSVEEKESLFYIFNTLKSPAPDPAQIKDNFAAQAVAEILGIPSELHGLRSELYPFQRRSAAAMIQRESSPARSLDPRLQKFQGPTGQRFFYIPETGELFRDGREYDEARGGILAETMGFGKSLICLTVILATKGHFPEVPPEYSLGLHPIRPHVATLVQMAAAAAGRLRVPWKARLDRLAEIGEDHQICRNSLQENSGSYILPAPTKRSRRAQNIDGKGRIVKLSSTTLLVVPQNLVIQWRNEVKRHVEDNVLKVLVLDSRCQIIPPVDELARQDLVIITKQRFEREVSLPLAMCQMGEGCTCNKSCHGCSQALYHSPLKDIHFLRIIVDEGHNFASSASQTNAMRVFSILHVERRWLVTGTPGVELLGVEVTQATNETLNDTECQPDIDNRIALQARKDVDGLAEESRDLVKLGRIVVDFLRLRPWANSKNSEDAASWATYIVPDMDSRRKTQTLRNTLEGLVLRHRIQDIEKDLKLPPLHNRVVYLEPSFHDKLSLNLFILFLTANAVTSERTDQDYMFHTRNRRQLDLLISNLRQAGFYWTSFVAHEVYETIQLSRAYLDSNVMSSAQQDRALLEEAVVIGRIALESQSWHAFGTLHELGLFVRDFPENAQDEWSLVPEVKSGLLLIGATQLAAAQSHIDGQLYAPDPTIDLASYGLAAMQKARTSAEEKLFMKSNPMKRTEGGRQKKGIPQSSLGVETKVKKQATMSQGKQSPNPSPTKVRKSPVRKELECTKILNNPTGLKSALKNSSYRTLAGVPNKSPLVRTRLCGSASAKLSYLLDRILILHKKEKILIFYEGDHIAYYIAQVLDIIKVQYLIYTKTLTVSRRSAYITTFNMTETFRVLLMDVHEASHGLHIASASRVFIVNPVWQPNVEAQAIKRAHRIGQTRPVYVETLVLRGTLEDQMLKRRKAMSAHEHQKAEKSLLDDSTMESLIQNARCIPVSEQEIKNVHNQVAPLLVEQEIFGRTSKLDVSSEDPDADLLLDELSSVESSSRKRDKMSTRLASGEQEISDLVSPLPSRRRSKLAAKFETDDEVIMPSPKKRSKAQEEVPSFEPGQDTIIVADAEVTHYHNDIRKRARFVLDDELAIRSDITSGPSRAPKKRARFATNLEIDDTHNSGYPSKDGINQYDENANAETDQQASRSLFGEGVSGLS